MANIENEEKLKRRRDTAIVFSIHFLFTVIDQIVSGKLLLHEFFYPFVSATTFYFVWPWIRNRS